MNPLEDFQSCAICADDPTAHDSNPILTFCYCSHKRIGIVTVVGQSGYYAERQCSPCGFASMVARHACKRTLQLQLAEALKSQ